MARTVIGIEFRNCRGISPANTMQVYEGIKILKVIKLF